MHPIQTRLTAGLLLAVLVIAAPLQTRADADGDAGIEAAGHLIEAENALQAGDYLKAAREYRLAAELSDNVDMARNATHIALRLGFNEEGMKAARRWLELDEDDDEARILYAQLALRVGDIREARHTIAKLIETGDDNGDRRLLSLLPILSEEDPKNADKLMRDLAKRYKDSAAANYATAVMALQAGDSRYALKKAGVAIELEPEWLKPRLVYGRALLLEGRTEEAIEYMAEIIGDNPQADPDARMEMALMYMSVGRDDDALSQINQILLEHGGRPDALRLMGVINFRKNNLDAAEQDFEDLLDSGGFTMDAFYYLGRIADVRGEQQEAVKFYRQVREGQHTVTAQRRASALMALELDEPDEALHQLDKFGERYPEYAVDMVVAKAQLLAALQRFDESLYFYDQAEEFRPDDQSTALGRAALLLEMDRLDESIDAYRGALKRWPESALVLNALGYTLADRTDEYTEAEKLIRKALKLEPDNPAIIDSMGWVLYKRGKYDRAYDYLQRAYQQFPDPEVAAHLVDVLFEMDRDEQALEILAEAEARNAEHKLLQDVRQRRIPHSE